MTDCKGLFGKIFGHEFVKYPKRIVPRYSTQEVKGGMEHMTKYAEVMRDEYEIRCKRCGAKPRDNNAEI